MNSSSGNSFIGLLAVLLIGLKLTNHITWPWIWVLSPIWISFLIFFGFAIAMFIGYWFLNKK